jgi:hypothetical protein
MGFGAYKISWTLCSSLGGITSFDSNEGSMDEVTLLLLKELMNI